MYADLDGYRASSNHPATVKEMFIWKVIPLLNSDATVIVDVFVCVVFYTATVELSCYKNSLRHLIGILLRLMT